MTSSGYVRNDKQSKSVNQINYCPKYTSVMTGCCLKKEACMFCPAWSVCMESTSLQLMMSPILFRCYFACGHRADCHNTLGIYSGGFVSDVLEERPRQVMTFCFDSFCFPESKMGVCLNLKLSKGEEF